jgi:ribosomal subunit interface protein
LLVKQPVQITFRDLPASDAVRAYVMRHATKLDRFFDGIVACHVVLEAPHRHHQHGKRYHVRIGMLVPLRELVVSRNPAANPRHEDLYAAIDDAFDDAERLLEDYARRLHERRSPHGRVGA